ncbi:hypothetical protein DER45DRAFT_525100 [Fusarium avenaceum]|nr:hypothetical protein DER45DRAFT_525100 [Fusarium avenaceum]
MDPLTPSENLRLMQKPYPSEDVQKVPEKEERTLPTLKECSPPWIWRVGVHAILLVVPIAYLVLLGVVGRLGGQKRNSFGDNVLEVLQLASTLWPISFAAVLGPFLKTLALFRAEKGTTVGSLEFLLTGQTTVAAFKNLFTVQYIRIWTVGIVAVWCFSPLGGQAVVRSMHLEPNTESTEIAATHYFSQVPLKILDDYSTNLTGDVNAFALGSRQLSLIAEFRRIVLAAFSGPDISISHANGSSDGFEEALARIGGSPQAARLGRQDIWRNVRIPFMEYLSGYKAEDPTAWTSVPSDEVVPFSSFIGVPIRGGAFSRVGNSSMELHSRYQTLECGDAFNGTDWVVGDGNSSKMFFHRPIPNAKSLLEISKQRSSFTEAYDDETRASLWLDSMKNNDTTSQLYSIGLFEPESKLQLLVGGVCLREPDLGYIAIRTCNVSTSYVDVAVQCTRLDDFGDLDCQATRIRRSRNPNFSPNLSDLSSFQIAGSTVFEMPFTTANYDALLPSLLEKYLRNPPTVFNYEFDTLKRMYGACFDGVPRRAFEARFATALNTFLMATYNYTVLTGADGTSLNGRNDMWRNYTATWTQYTEEVYTLNVVWYSISAISTLLLLACTIANILIRHVIIAPDFLDSIDGLIRGSPFIKIDNKASDVGTGLSSHDRIRVVKNIQVQIQDVQPEMDAGKIALTSDLRNSKLDWRRAYH